MFRSSKAALGGEPGAECGFDAGEHQIEGAGQPSHFGGVVLAGHPLGQIARSDRLCCQFHVPQWSESQTDQPESADERHHHRRRRHRQLDQQQVVQGAADVTERLGHDENLVVTQLRGAHPKGRTVTLDGRSIKVDGRGGTGGQAGNGRGDLGRVGGAAHIGGTTLRIHDATRQVTHLDGEGLNGVGGLTGGPAFWLVGRPEVRGEGSGAGGGGEQRSRLHQTLEATVELIELLIDPLVEEGLEGRIGDHIGDGQRHHGDDPDGDQQSGPERHGLSGGGLA